MWSPTHIQVTVQRAKGLLTKGKNGTNNCFVTIALGKEKYQTSLKDKASANVDWHEECELKIPDQGNRAELVLTCLHRNNLGIDEFLGQATLPLNEMDVYDRPRSKWMKLESKPGKEKKKERGELEVRISFIVKSGSLTDLSKKEKHKSSVGQLASSVGGSLLSIGTIEKRKSITKFAKSLGSKMHLNNKKKNKELDTDSFTGSFGSIGTPSSNSGRGNGRYSQGLGEADPGVISEDEDEFGFDNLSHKSSNSSLNIRSGLRNHIITPSPLLGRDDDSLHSRIIAPSKPPRNSSNDSKLDEWETKLYGKHLDISNSDSLKRRSWETSRVPLPSNTEETDETESARDLKEAAEAENMLASKEAKKLTEFIQNTAHSDQSKSKAELTTSSKSQQESKQKKLSPMDFEKVCVATPVDNISSQQSKSAAAIKVSKGSNRQSSEAFIESEKNINSSKPEPAISPAVMNRSFTQECLTDLNATNGNFVSTLSPASSVGNIAKESDHSISNSRERIDKKHRFNKFKYFNKKEKNDSDDLVTSGDRIVIAHEKLHMPRSEISAALAKKYDGKSREELMLIANGMETEALIQRQRVKELEDYLDNLLLRVMETHPKILQNPYLRTSSAKSFKSYIPKREFS